MFPSYGFMQLPPPYYGLFMGHGYPLSWYHHHSHHHHLPQPVHHFLPHNQLFAVPLQAPVRW